MSPLDAEAANASVGFFNSCGEATLSS